MKTILEYINRNSFENTCGNIYFELDEESLNILTPEFREMITEGYHISVSNIINEMAKYPEKEKLKKKGGNRQVWVKDGDELKIGSHATEREDRPTEKGGDGEHIDEQEIIDMFKYTWKDIMEMYYDGYLDAYEYNDESKRSFTTECQCYLVEERNKLVADGARPTEKTLWSAWMPQEGHGNKVDIIIRTIFRGTRLKHGRRQERIKVLRNGKIQQIKPRY